jgi:hypothetical protein
MEEKRNAYRTLLEKPDGKIPQLRPRCEWEDNIKMDLREIGWGGMDWTDLSLGKDRWWTLVNTVMNLLVP